MKHTQIRPTTRDIGIKMISSKYSFVTLNCMGIYPVVFAINAQIPWSYKEELRRTKINTVHNIKEIIKEQAWTLTASSFSQTASGKDNQA